MAEILLMKSLKALLSFFCYFGTGIVAMDAFVLQTLDSEILNFSPSTRKIVFLLFVVLSVVNIVWKIYEKFYLETKERKQGIEKMAEEIKKMKQGHEKEK